MKKVLVLVFAMVFVLSAGIFADMKDKGMDCGMMWMKGDVKVENTANGASILFTSKDAKEVKEIQEGAAKMAEMCSKMQNGKGMDMDGMWGHGMGMNPMMGQHMQKKLGVVFGFLCTIWSLIIILLACTIVLVIKKIMAK